MSDDGENAPSPEADAKVEEELARVTVPEAGLRMGELPETAPEPLPETEPIIDPSPERRPPVTEPEPQPETLPEPVKVSQAVALSPEAQMKRMTRRGLITGVIAAAAGYGSWRWLLSRADEGGVPSSFRRVLEANEVVAEKYFSPSRLSPSFPLSAVSGIRVNGHLGLESNVDLARWKLNIEGAAAGPLVLTLADIRALPRHDVTTEFRCIEGWSFIVHWTGARLSDLVERFPPASRDGRPVDAGRLETMPRYVGMETPGRGYYVGLDMASALHPQTLLAYEMNGAPLSWDHGAPIRLAIPVKYGIKNIKRIGLIRYTDVRPADFWAEQGYDWYAGH